MGHEAEKGVFYPLDPRPFILLTTSVSGTNHMGCMSRGEKIGPSITLVLRQGYCIILVWGVVLVCGGKQISGLKIYIYGFRVQGNGTEFLVGI